MAGYSQRSLKDKLGFKPNMISCVLSDDKGLNSYLKKVLPGAHVLDTFHDLNGEYDYIHYFTKDTEDLRHQFPILKKHLKKTGMLWISWPKKTSKVATDLDENIIRSIMLENGLVDVKVAAIDDTWSGLKAVYRLGDR